jgi:hypothetical protein
MHPLRACTLCAPSSSPFPPRLSRAYGIYAEGWLLPRQRDPEVLQQKRQRPTRAPSPLTFHSTPEDIVVSIAFLLHLRGPCPSWKKAVTTISCHALFALVDTGTGTGRPTSRYDEEDADAGSREEADQGQEQEGGVGVPVGEAEEAEIVLWEEWGPRAARVISPPTFHWITAHAGQPWLSLDDKLVIRDFSTARVLGSRAARGAAPQQPIISLADLLLTSATTTTTTTLEKTKIEEQRCWCWRRPKRASVVMVGVKCSTADSAHQTGRVSERTQCQNCLLLRHAWRCVDERGIWS